MSMNGGQLFSNMHSRVHQFYLATLLLTGLTLGCQKTAVKDPCAGLMNEGPLKQIGVIFVDKGTGDYLIKTSDRESSGIKVTNAGTEEPYNNWDIYYHHENPTALNGIVRLYGIPETEGTHSYDIQSDDFGTVTLSYTVIKMENNSDSPCISPYYYSITDVRIEDHPFDVFEYENGTIIPNALVVAL